MQQWHTMDREQVLSELKTDAKAGLPAEQAGARLAEYGENKLAEKKKETNLQRFLRQFKDVMIIILLIAAAISFIVALSGHEEGEFLEPIVIIGIVVMNAFLGMTQESKAEKALEALQSMTAPKARVVRGGAEQLIPSEQVVPGDVVLIEAGDFVPADARLLESSNLKIEEAPLTGESVPVEKYADVVMKEKDPLAERANMVYAGCSVTYGRGRAVVCETGMHTEMGKIAGLLGAQPPQQTPLQKQLAKLGKNLGILALAVCGVIFVVGLIDGMEILEIFMTSVSLAVAVIPEGLPAIVTVVLAIGVQRMVKKNAIIRRLPAVETLGSASVICSDKTGTLTQNRMTLVQAVTEKADEKIGDNSDEIDQLLMYATLCCDGSVTMDEATKRFVHIGDPTETCIVLAALQNGMPREELQEQHPRLAEIPFDSDRKLMSVVCDMYGKNMVIVKGALDVLKDRCDAGDLELAQRRTDEMSKDALRVLAVAYKEIETVPKEPTVDDLEYGLTFMGLLGMIDPPRGEAKDAVAVCREAGIRPVMITGDNIVTASAIAKELGILREGDKAMTGAELEAIPEEKLTEVVKDVSVYARVSPENKISIVKAWQANGNVVAMTGDGVNDAPALKAADIGCAMGITGTDVAKQAADMTLTDDNFATIVEAVRQGRGIYDNIKRTVTFLLSTNIGELVTVLVALLAWGTSPLVALQLLWINLVTDTLPAIALGMEAIDPGVMSRPPKPNGQSMFAGGLGVRIALQGLMFGLLSVFAFWLGMEETGNVDGGRTMAFFVLALSQVVHAFNMRSDRSLFAIGMFSSKVMNLSALGSAGLLCVVLFIPPIASVFGLVLLPGWMYAVAVALSFVSIVVMEIAKKVGLIRHKH